MHRIQRHGRVCSEQMLCTKITPIWLSTAAASRATWSPFSTRRPSSFSLALPLPLVTRSAFRVMSPRPVGSQSFQSGLFWKILRLRLCTGLALGHWELGLRGTEPFLAVLPVFYFTLIMNHDLLEPKSVCSVGKKVGNVAKVGIGLGRKSLRLEGTPGQAFLGFWGSLCPRFSRQTEFLLCLLCFRTHCILEI